MRWSANRPLTRLEKGLLCFFFLGVLPAFGAMVEYRSAFLSRRMGDLDCFLRAAWAVRTGEDIYSVTSDNDWHYNYPPLCAILMTPLADPPKGFDSAGFLPYPLSVLICFVFNVGCMIAAAHFLASAFEQTSDDPAFRTQPTYCVRWWLLRMAPVLVCFLPIGHTMMRGQVNLFILAVLCAALAGWMRGQNFSAGMWLALAICIKVIPAFLLVYPLWKRDGRALAGCAAGLVGGLVIVPLLTFGPGKTVTLYETYGRVFFGPFLKVTEDDSRKDEMLGGVNATESVGVRNALHNWMYPSPEDRPPDLHVAAKAIYLLLGIVMTFLTLWPRADSTVRVAHQLAALIVLMMMFSPVSHSHYLLFCLPIVMSLLAHSWQGQATVHVPWLLTISFAALFVTMAIAYLPGLEILKDRCASLFAALPLWAIPVAQLWRGTTNQPTAVPVPASRAA